MKDCVFCKIANNEADRDLILKTQHFFVVRDINQKIAGHSLVIPKEHFETFLDLPPKYYEELLQATKDATKKLLKEQDTEGYNLLINNKPVAGQVVPHLHFHILPRKKGDGLRVLE